MISLDNLRTVLNAIKHTLDSTKQDKLIAGKNITIAEDGKTISATGIDDNIFSITITGNTDEEVVADKTYAEIKAAIDAGYPIHTINKHGDIFVPRVNFESAVERITLAWTERLDSNTWVEVVYEVNTQDSWGVTLREYVTPNEIGNLIALKTQAKDNLVVAINEVKQTTDAKQNKLIAGENITIAADGKTISATGGGGTTVELDTTLSKAGKAADAKAVGDALAGKVDKVTDKGLSTNDYTNAAKAKVDAIPADPKYTDTVYDDTKIRESVSILGDELAVASGRITDIEAELSGHGSVTISDLTTTNGLTTKGEVEIYGDQPHIDFHYNNSTEDHTSRIIESASGKVDVLAANGLFSNGKKVALKSDLATSNITLTVNNNRLKDFSYTAKYVPVIPAVFVRAYGVVNADMNAGYDYDIINIGSNSPNWQTALSIKSAKNVMAVAKNGGVISIRPLEAGIKNYDVYIAGFWFV